MCLAALAWNAHPRWRLLLVGNRDEFHARPTAPLSAWQSPPGVIAGRDLSAGGTWVAADTAGRAAIVTNVRQGLAPMHEGPSRGELPLAFLGTGQDADSFANTLQERADDYAPFNLIIADTNTCAYVSNRPIANAKRINRGVHALSNGALDASWPKVDHLHLALQKFIDSEQESLQPLWDALADETIAKEDALPDTGVGIELERRLSPAFIRGADYGTRASTIIAIDHGGSGFVHERRFGPNGVFAGETQLPIFGQ